MITVVSFGYLHGEPPAATVTLDVRTVLRDPHVDPAMRQQTGLDQDVRERVLATPGAPAILDAAARLATALRWAAIANNDTQPVTVAIGCAGGRHRSVALAEALAARLTADGVETTPTHRDIHRPVVHRPA